MSELKTVPVTPTKAMLKAGSDDLLLRGYTGTLFGAAECWRAMIAAAPEQALGPTHGRTNHPPPCPPAPKRPRCEALDDEKPPRAVLSEVRSQFEPELVTLICGLRRHQVKRAVMLLLDYIDLAAAVAVEDGRNG